MAIIRNTEEEFFEKYEIGMWEAAKKRDTEKFLQYVDTNAIMVCGGYRCSGKEYGELIAEFDLASYTIEHMEWVAVANDLIQLHYVIQTKVSDPANVDLAGTFHITSTWKKEKEDWKLIFNMDSRIIG